jgi:hypothetical protein
MISIPMIMFLTPHMSLVIEKILPIPSIIRNRPFIQTMKPSNQVNFGGLNLI